MQTIHQAGTFTLGSRTVKRLGYGAMQLAGPGVFGPPRDRNAALAVLRRAVEAGVDHTYGDDLLIVTKIGARRDENGAWLPAFAEHEMAKAVEDNLRHLGLQSLEIVNLYRPEQRHRGANPGSSRHR
jgi:aryl-alcohol dehydrogenase-like predicted oxidoreductase